MVQYEMDDGACRIIQTDRISKNGFCNIIINRFFPMSFKIWQYTQQRQGVQLDITGSVDLIYNDASNQ